MEFEVFRHPSEEELEKNKETFLSLARTYIKRDGIDKLLGWLEGTDFFATPASTRFHEAYAGGLCEHSLNVLKKLVQLNEEAAEEYKLKEESMVLTALFHDLCKANFYTVSYRNAKNEETGQWEKVPFYQVDDRFPFGHGEKSVFLMERFVRLKPIEAMAIRWHMGSFDESARGGSFALGNAFEMFPAILNLHVADLMATYQSGPC